MIVDLEINQGCKISDYFQKIDDLWIESKGVRDFQRDFWFLNTEQTNPLIILFAHLKLENS